MKKILLTAFGMICLFQFSSAQSLQNVIIEKHTGAWCGFCPEGAEILDQIVTNNPNAIPVAIHDGDQMYVTWGGVIANFYGPAYPQATINRSSAPVSRGSWASSVMTATQAAPSCYVSIDSLGWDWVQRLLTVRVKVDFVQQMSGQFRFNAYLVEREMTGSGNGWDQTNYFNTNASSTFYQMGNPIPNYTHKYVFRDALGGAWGTPAIIPGTVNAGESYTHTYQKILPNNIQATDLNIVGLVNLHGGQTPNSRPTLNSAQMSLDLVMDLEEGLNANSEVMTISPNPATDRVSIAYTVEQMGTITLEVRNQLGQLVRTLGHDMKNAGAHTYVWDGNDAIGQPVANGLYMVRMITESGQSLTKKVLIAR
ncbi:MAG: Omp28-related outer membrane protein [Bacteroidota bacterium]